MEFFLMYGYTIPIEAPRVPIGRILQDFWFVFHPLLALRFNSFVKHTCHSLILHPVHFFLSVFYLFRCLFCFTEGFRTSQWFLVDFVIFSQFCYCFDTTCQLLNPVIKRQFLKKQTNAVDYTSLLWGT